VCVAMKSTKLLNLFSDSRRAANDDLICCANPSLRTILRRERLLNFVMKTLTSFSLVQHVQTLKGAMLATAAGGSAASSNIVKIHTTLAPPPPPHDLTSSTAGSADAGVGDG